MRMLMLLALSVARVAVNEGAFQNPLEVSLVWQVVEGSGKTTEKRLEFLKRHSPHVMGKALCGNLSNCRWARELDEEGSLPPTLAIFGTDEKWWLLRRRDTWLTILWAAQQFATGRLTAKPCAERPDTWGSVTNAHDLAWSERHGLHRLHCKGVLNDGWKFDQR